MNIYALYLFIQSPMNNNYHSSTPPSSSPRVYSGLMCHCPQCPMENGPKITAGDGR